MQPTHQQDADYRRLWPADRQVFLEHLMHLDVASRNDRFGGAISDAVIATYAKHSFHHDDVIYGAFVGDTLRAVGELRAITSNFALPEAGTAEAAFSVETAFRRRGIGSNLLARVLRSATNRGVKRVQVFCLSHNAAMLALARKYRIGMFKEHDPRASRQDNTEILTLAPTPISLWREAADTAMGTLSALVTLQQTLFTATADKS